MPFKQHCPLAHCAVIRFFRSRSRPLPLPFRLSFFSIPFLVRTLTYIYVPDHLLLPDFVPFFQYAVSEHFQFRYTPILCHEDNPFFSFCKWEDEWCIWMTSKWTKGRKGMWRKMFILIPNDISLFWQSNLWFFLWFIFEKWDLIKLKASQKDHS